MRTLALASLSLVLVTGLWLARPGPSVAPARAETVAFTVDVTHSTILFKVSHLGLGVQYGRFNAFSGTFELGDEMNAGGVSVEIDMASIDSNNEGRDTHLKGADYFNVGEYPKASFTSTSITKTGDDTYDVEGNLTLHGVTRTETLEMKKLGEGDRGRFGYRAGFEGTLVIQRSQYGMSEMLEGIGDEVTILLAVEGTRQ